MMYRMCSVVFEQQAGASTHAEEAQQEGKNLIGGSLREGKRSNKELVKMIAEIFAKTGPYNGTNERYWVASCDAYHRGECSAYAAALKERKMGRLLLPVFM
jgi:hypothetical protein